MSGPGSAEDAVFREPLVKLHMSPWQARISGVHLLQTS